VKNIEREEHRTHAIIFVLVRNVYLRNARQHRKRISIMLTTYSYLNIAHYIHKRYILP